MKKRYLILADGTTFTGQAFGADTPRVGELVFTTGMNGYIETLTDPSYFGQIVLQTFPMIGNYGIISDDYEGECSLFGYVVREWCDLPSNFRCEKTLDIFLKEKNIPGIYGIDTRAVTKIIREHGVMNAVITDDMNYPLDTVKSYTITKAVASVTVKETCHVRCESPEYRVALLDFGAKKNIERELVRRNCSVDILPATTTAQFILSGDYDGVMLSNGPGDPAENVQIIAELSKLIGKKPLFGICLGHQLLALAAGGKTTKLKYGHRGANQPVRDLIENRTYITSQNHGYAVVSDSVSRGTIRYVNANDFTCEGIDYLHDSAFTVQFHPEASSGPHDTEFLFDRFITLMGGAK